MTPTDQDRAAAEELLRAKWLGLSDAEYVKLFTDHFARHAEAARREERSRLCKRLRLRAESDDTRGELAAFGRQLMFRIADEIERCNQLEKDGA